MTSYRSYQHNICYVDTLVHVHTRHTGIRIKTYVYIYKRNSCPEFLGTSGNLLVIENDTPFVFGDLQKVVSSPS